MTRAINRVRLRMHRIKDDETSSPSPMQLPKSDHVDQFQGNPAIDRIAFSMVSSRLDRRERNNAFLLEQLLASISTNTENRTKIIAKDH